MKTKKLFLLVFVALTTLFSCNQQKVQKESKAEKPNILLIVADDMGYSDIAPFGGNIRTPVISQLAGEGILFSNFHVQPTCSPTRSSLLTGNDNHVAGFGIMSEMEYSELPALTLPG